MVESNGGCVVGLRNREFVYMRIILDMVENYNRQIALAFVSGPGAKDSKNFISPKKWIQSIRIPVSMKT